MGSIVYATFLSLRSSPIMDIRTSGYIRILARRHRWQGSNHAQPKIFPLFMFVIGSQKFEKYNDPIIANKDWIKIIRSRFNGFIMIFYKDINLNFFWMILLDKYISRDIKKITP